MKQILAKKLQIATVTAMAETVIAIAAAEIATVIAANPKFSFVRRYYQ